MLLSRKKITEDLIDMMMGWRHSGFNVYCGPRIQPGEEEAIENLACYIIGASFSQERMTYIPEDSKVVYRSKDGKEEKAFDALEWLAAMCSHVPNKRESFDLEALDRQMVRYYGYYSNVSRGKRKKQDQDGLIPCILDPVEAPDFSGDGFSRKSRKNWARLIQKILKHLGLWPVESLKVERVALCRPRVSRGLPGGQPSLIFKFGGQLSLRPERGEMYNLFPGNCRAFHQYAAGASFFPTSKCLLVTDLICT